MAKRGLGGDKRLAMIETEQAAIAAAEFALRDLIVIGMTLSHLRWSTELAERYQEDLQLIRQGLGVTRDWMAQFRAAGIVSGGNDDHEIYGTS